MIVYTSHPLLSLLCPQAHCMYVPQLFIHSSVYGHLGCIHVLAIVNIVAMNTVGYMCLIQLWFSQGVCPVAGLLGHMVDIFQVFKGIFTLFSIIAVSVYIPTNNTSSPAFTVCRVYDDGHSDWCRVMPHSSFDLHFPSN